LKYIKLSK